MLDFRAGTVFAEHEHDGVVAGNGADDFVEVMHVNVVSQTAGITGSGLDYGDVVGELDRDETIVAQHFAGFLRLVMRLYIVLLGSTYT